MKQNYTELRSNSLIMPSRLRLESLFIRRTNMKKSLRFGSLKQGRKMASIQEPRESNALFVSKLRTLEGNGCMRKGRCFCPCFVFVGIHSSMIQLRKKRTEFPSKLIRKTSTPDSTWPAAPVTQFHYFTTRWTGDRFQASKLSPRSSRAI